MSYSFIKKLYTLTFDGEYGTDLYVVLIFQESVPYNLLKGKQCSKDQNKSQRKKHEVGVSAVYFTCGMLVALIAVMTLLLQTVDT